MRHTDHYTSCITSGHQVLVIGYRDQREPEAEAFSAVLVSIGDDLKAFHGTDDVFGGNAVFRGADELLSLKLAAPCGETLGALVDALGAES